MPDITLIIPGFLGSGPDHWQTWMESRVKGARRVTGIDWEAPILDDWAAAVRRELMQAADPVWLVAHSFGCLATIAATQGLAHRIAGAMLVAPPDPDWFTPLGLRPDAPGTADTLSSVLPRRDLGIPSLVVASSNDPWMPIEKLIGWSASWGSRLINIGNAGHINTDAGFGPWPAGLELFRSLQTMSESDRTPNQLMVSSFSEIASGDF
jgi:predicted alpha/beta hydrolase family esterase